MTRHSEKRLSKAIANEKFNAKYDSSPLMSNYAKNSQPSPLSEGKFSEQKPTTFNLTSDYATILQLSPLSEYKFSEQEPTIFNLSSETLYDEYNPIHLQLTDTSQQFAPQIEDTFSPLNHIYPNNLANSSDYPSSLRPFESTKTAPIGEDYSNYHFNDQDENLFFKPTKMPYYNSTENNDEISNPFVQLIAHSE